MKKKEFIKLFQRYKITIRVQDVILNGEDEHNSHMPVVGGINPTDGRYYAFDGTTSAYLVPEEYLDRHGFAILEYIRDLIEKGKLKKFHLKDLSKK